MIIFGTKGKHSKIGEGEFYCPKCAASRHYFHKKVQRYFSLYFIPIIPIGDLGEYVECQTCFTTFKTDVLSLKAPAHPPLTLAQALNKIPELLDSGIPVEYLIRDLNAAGLDREVAQKTVAGYVTKPAHFCQTCGLTYVNTITTCQSCGQNIS